jgi:MSHA biogenesis protein MshK
MKNLLLLFFCLTNAQANTLEDPTKPNRNDHISTVYENSDELAPAALKLTAIIINSISKQAIINGISFTEGQQVQGYKVIFISQNHVVLNSSDGKQSLFVNNNNIKKDANNGS